VYISFGRFKAISVDVSAYQDSGVVLPFQWDSSSVQPDTRPSHEITTGEVAEAVDEDDDDEIED
jgi:hypothetical protein